jgi:DNA (cytosine-5)-methyltransferase 1
MTMRVLDLFSGIGGFSLGLERTGGFTTVAFCEVAEYPRRVLAKHWPGVPIYHDVRELSRAKLAADGLADVDVICGGFPCQDLSFAGKRAGLEGARSGLWGEYARLIGELRPRFCIVENVPGLLSLGMGTVCGDLAALGYDAVWDCVPASAVGAPHRRDRVWLIAHSDRHELRQQSGRRGGQGWAGAAFAGEHGAAQSVADADFQGLEVGQCLSGNNGAQRAASVGGGGREPQSRMGRMVDGISHRAHGGRLDAPRMGAAQGGAAGGESGRQVVRAMRRDASSAAAPSRLQQADGSADPLRTVPHQGGPSGRVSAHEAAATVRPMRGGILADAQQEARSVQSGVPLGNGPAQRLETVGQWESEPDIPRVAKGVKNRVDRLKGLGNAVVPQIPELIGNAILRSLA